METVPRKYKSRSGTQDEGKDYELEMTAYLALRSIRYAKKVSIAFNADGVGDFDDVVLMITTQNDQRLDFLIQLKHKAEPNNLTLCELEDGSGRLPFRKYCEHMVILKKDIKTKKKQGTITNDLGSFENIYFVLYTNRGMELNNFVENKWLFYEIDKDDAKTIPLKTLLNTYSDNHCVFKFNLFGIPEDITTEDGENFRNFRLLTNQISFKDLHYEIVNEIRTIVPFKLLKVNENDIADEFIKYIKNWARGLLVNHHYLDKDAILFKLTELCLKQYEVNLRPKLVEDYDLDQKSIWNELVSDQPVTIVDSNEMTVKFMVQYISNEVAKYFSGSGKNFNDKLSRKEQHEFYSDPNSLQQPMKSMITNNGTVSMMDIYKCLWKLKKLPLLLQVENVREFENIIGILKLSDFSHSVIILNGSSEALPRFGDVQIFVSLNDLDAQKREKVLQEPSELQGRLLPHLRDVIDDTMFEDIKSIDVLKILSGTFSIGEKVKELPDYFIHRNTSKVLIKSQVFDWDNGDTFLFEGDGDVANHSGMVIRNLEDASSENVHFCCVYNEDYFEWIRTKGSTKRIQTFRDRSILEYEAEMSSSNHTNIISEVPGMGKSIFMDYIAYKTPSTKWVLRIDLNKHLTYYRKSNDCRIPNAKAIKHLSYFFNKQENNVLTKKVFDKLLTKNNVIILLDGFDEISISYKTEVTNIALSLQKGGYHVWLTTRPHMLEHLEETLNTFGVSLQPFTEENQQEFLVKFFQNKTSGCHTRIGEFVEGLLLATKMNLYDYEAKFTGIPLQTELLADYFLEKCKECLSSTTKISFTEKFDLLELYRSVIAKKIDELENRFDDSDLQFTDRYRKDQPLLALQLVFPLDEFEEIPEITEKNEYYEKRNKKEYVQRDGVITLDEQFNLNYNHRSFAEFQAAQWLTENLHTDKKHLREFILDLTKQRFSKNYQFLFNIFDRTLSQDCDLHTAVICGQYETAKNIMNSGNFDDFDGCGRTILHILALYDEENQLSENQNSIAMEILKKVPNFDKLYSVRDVLGFTALDYALGNKSSLILANALCGGSDVAPIKAQIDPDSIYLYLSTCEERGLKTLFDMLLPYFVSRDFIQGKTTNTNLKTYLRSKSVDHTSDYVSSFVGGTILEFLRSRRGFPNERYEKDNYSDLRYAIRYGNRKNVLDVLTKTEDINAKDVDDNTPLFYAIISENLDTVRILLEKRADLNKKNSENRTALHLAFQTKNLDLIKLILSKTPNYNASDNKGRNVLHYAVNYGNLNIVEEIITKVDDLNKQDHKGNIPLHSAIIENNFAIANLLIKSGSDINILNYENRNALHYAIIHDSENLIDKTCFKNVDPNIQDMEGNTPLHLELQYFANIKTVEFLIAKGADATVQNLRKETPLHLILNKPNCLKSIVKLLLAHGADVNTTNNLEETAVHIAIKNSNFAVVGDLLPKLKDKNQRDCYQNSCLHLAAKKRPTRDYQFVNFFQT